MCVCMCVCVCMCAYSTYVGTYICLRASVFFFQRLVCETVCVCVCAAHSGSRADLVSHAEGLWSPRPTDHRIVALNGPQIIKQATRIERNAGADGRSAG